MAVPLWLAATVGVTGVLLSRVDYNIFFMKFFRNLSRSKARARLYNNKYAMIPVMLGIEEPIKIKDDIDAENAMHITREQLEEMDGYDGAPLYLSIKGRVYDVSAGGKFYAEGGEYHDWVGRDASRSFGTGCRGGVDRTGMECLSESMEGLTDKEIKEIDRWLELYETHDKYTFVGYLVDDPVEEIVERVHDEENEAAAAMEEEAEEGEDVAEDDEEEEEIAA
jgi:predicted heme/steroid binding protein